MTTRLLIIPILVLAISSVATGTARADDTTRATAPTSVRIRGTIDKYDAATRTLSLITADGTLQIQLAATARVRRGWRDVDASELEKLAGYSATVRYSESGGDKTAESIHVFGKRERTNR